MARLGKVPESTFRVRKIRGQWVVCAPARWLRRNGG